jgi:hypothetical protein
LRILSVLASKYDRSVVYCGADSLTSGKVSVGKGIFQSLDTGKTWHRVGAPNAQVFQIAEHPLDPQYLAAACGTEGVWISGSFGWEWEKYNDGLPANVSVRRIAIPAWDINTNGFISFAGTFADGLYVSKRITTDVHNDLPVELNNDLRIISVYPQPATDIVKFDWNNPANLNANIRLMDALGNVVYKDFSNNQQGRNFSSLPTGALANGVYLLNIEVGGESVTSRVIISR